MFTDAFSGSDGALLHVRELVAADPERYFYADQYRNPANPLAHYRTTGPELWEQTQGRLTHFVAGLGTSGTIVGTGRYLHERLSARPRGGGRARRATARPGGHEAPAERHRAGDLRCRRGGRQGARPDRGRLGRLPPRLWTAAGCCSATPRAPPSGRRARWRAAWSRAWWWCSSPTAASDTCAACARIRRRREAIQEHARGRLPFEVCGVLLGRTPGRRARGEGGGGGEPRDGDAAGALPDRARGPHPHRARGARRRAWTSSATTTAIPTIPRGRRRPTGAWRRRASRTAWSTWWWAWSAGSAPSLRPGSSGTRARRSSREPFEVE